MTDISNSGVRSPVSSGRRQGYAGKRALDVALILGTLPFWGVVMIIVAIAVRIRLGSPVLFRQTRPGIAGRPFLMLKFRSMTDERTKQGDLESDAARLTPFGMKLRAASLDELPELLNVLRGEMSLVGPRPLLNEYLPRYSARHAHRHDVRPGITGLAQVSGRNALSWPQKFDLDVEYAERCSLALDISILWRTARAVLRREGVAAADHATMPEFTGYDSTRETPPAAPLR